VKRSPLHRKTPLAAARRLPAVNRRRRVRTWERKYGSEERVLWFKSQACQTCGAPAPSENSHLRAGGSPSTILSQCHDCHRRLHEAGRHTFAESMGTTFEVLLKMALRQDAEWRAR
jgi:hypothetical protein